MDTEVRRYRVKTNTTINGVFLEAGRIVPLRGKITNCNLELLEVEEGKTVNSMKEETVKKMVAEKKPYIETSKATIMRGGH